MLSAMPPSTATYVRTRGSSFTEPTRYRAIPEVATSARPGSIARSGGRAKPCRRDDSATIRANDVRAESELRVRRAGLKVGVSVRGDARAHAEQDGLAHPRSGRAISEPADLLEVVDDHAAHPQPQRHLELVFGLVVPVERNSFRREAGERRGVKLATRDHVEAEPFLRREPQDPGRAVRLRRVTDRGPGRVTGERGAERAGASADGGLVVDVERRAIASRQLDQVATTDGEMSGGADVRRVGEDPFGERHGPSLCARRRRSSGLKSPLATSSAGPRSQISPSSAMRTSSSPPGIVTTTSRSISPARCAAAAAAQLLVPDASVYPAPRSQIRIARSRLERTCA